MNEPLINFTCETSIISTRTTDEGKIGELTKDLSFLSSNVQARLVYYANICFRIRDMFENELNDFRKRYKGIGENIDKIEDTHDKEIVTSRFLEQQWLFGERTEVQESAVTIGIFLKSYALLEDVLNMLCETYKQLTNSSKDIKNYKIKEKGIVRSSIYINDLVYIDISKSLEWKRIICWKKIRNQILHNDAKVTNNRNLIKSMNTLNIQGVRDTTVNDYKIINLKLSHVVEFLYLTDKILSMFVLHEDEWIKYK